MINLELYYNSFIKDSKREKDNEKKALLLSLCSCFQIAIFYNV